MMLQINFVHKKKKQNNNKKIHSLRAGISQFVVNGLGMVPVGSIPANNLKKSQKTEKNGC